MLFVYMSMYVFMCVFVCTCVSVSVCVFSCLSACICVCVRHLGHFFVDLTLIYCFFFFCTWVFHILKLFILFHKDIIEPFSLKVVIYIIYFGQIIFFLPQFLPDLPTYPRSYSLPILSPVSQNKYRSTNETQ